MDAYRIDDDGRSLELRCLQRGPGGEAAVIALTIRADGLDATVSSDGSEVGFEDLEVFFAGMLYSWQGWTGEVTYESFEHDVTLRARHDGRIRMSVDLAPNDRGSWRAHSEVSIAPGQLADAVAGVTSVLGSRLDP